MQIGRFQFDLQRQVLVDTQQDQTIELNQDEFNILRVLLSQKNKVVSKQLLLNELQRHVYPELELVDVIYQLRQHLGSDLGGLIETVADQGYILHSELKKGKSSLHDSPIQGMSAFVYCVLTGSLLLLVFWLYSAVESTPAMVHKSLSPLIPPIEQQVMVHQAKDKFLFDQVSRQASFSDRTLLTSHQSY